MYNSPRREWFMCPRCGKGKLLKRGPDTVIVNAECYCKYCGSVIVNIPVSQSQSRKAGARAD